MNQDFDVLSKKAAHRVSLASLQLREAHAFATSWGALAKSAATPEEKEACRQEFNVAQARWRDAYLEFEAARRAAR